MGQATKEIFRGTNIYSAPTPKKDTLIVLN